MIEDEGRPPQRWGVVVIDRLLASMLQKDHTEAVGTPESHSVSTGVNCLTEIG